MKQIIPFIIIFLVFFIIVTMAIYYSGERAYFTLYPNSLPSKDADTWNKLSDTDKLIYLAGYLEENDIAPASGNLYKRRAEEELESKNFILKDLKTGIDQFYSDSANKKIPISQAKIFVLRRIRQVKGDSFEVIQSEIEKVRSKFR